VRSIVSSLSIIFGESCSFAAARFSRRWPIEDVPGMRRMFGERWRSHASAT